MLLFVIFHGYCIPVKERCDEPLAGDLVSGEIALVMKSRWLRTPERALPIPNGDPLQRMYSPLFRPRPVAGRLPAPAAFRTGPGPASDDPARGSAGGLAIPESELSVDENLTDTRAELV